MKESEANRPQDRRQPDMTEKQKRQETVWQEKGPETDAPPGEKGMSTVEVILILVVLVALVLIFKNQLTMLVGKIFETINNTAASIY